MDWIRPVRLPKSPATPLSRAYYRKIGIGVFQEFPPVTQERINAECCLTRPPPRYVSFELLEMPSRSFAEWYLRRGKNPNSIRDRFVIETWMRDRVLDKHGMVCWLCDCAIAHKGVLHMDHVHPKSLGGDDTPSNLRPAHASCNIRRGNRDAAEFRRQLSLETEVR